MQGMGSTNGCLNSSQMSLQELRSTQQQQQIQNTQIQIQSSSHFDNSTNDDFFDQMLSNLPSWHELSGNPKSPWDLNPQNPNGNTTTTNNQKLFNNGNKSINLSEDQSASSNPDNLHYNCDESTLLASRLRQHQISGNSPKSMILQQQQLLLSRGGAGGGNMNRLPNGAACFGGDSEFFPLPLTLGNGDSSDSHLLVDRSLGNIPIGSLSTQTFSAPTTGINQAPATGSAGGGGAAPVRQKVRARRGQATDPHSIAERLRRERIAERMKALQELVPNANKTDKASMLDEIIDYVKFLQLQVKVLSMSRLGGASAVAPLVADVSSEGGGDCIQTSGAVGRSSNGTQTASSIDSLTVTEHQVVKLMEEDMGSAMQYLQGKGLCLMPISLASAISTATCHSRNQNHNNNPLLVSNADGGPSSPSISVLTVQSATMGNGIFESSVKDATSVCKP